MSQQGDVPQKMLTRWQRTKRYFDLADPYPYNPATYQPIDKVVSIAMTIALSAACIVVLIIIWFFASLFWSI